MSRGFRRRVSFLFNGCNCNFPNDVRGCFSRLTCNNGTLILVVKRFLRKININIYGFSILSYSMVILKLNLSVRISSNREQLKRKLILEIRFNIVQIRPAYLPVSFIKM